MIAQQRLRTAILLLALCSLITCGTSLAAQDDTNPVAVSLPIIFVNYPPLPPPPDPSDPNSIVGRWDVAYQMPGNAGPINYTYVFTADGSLSYTAWYGSGTGYWTQDGTNVEWLLDSSSGHQTRFTGVVDGFFMEGTLRTSSGQLVSWTAGRIGPRPPLPPPSDPSGPDSIVGRWDVTYQTPGNAGPINYTYVFTADGSLAYTNWSGSGTGYWTQDGTAVEWLLDSGNGYYTHFTGVVSGLSMEGTLRTSSGQLVSWTAGRL